MSSKDDLFILPWEEQEQTSDIRENFPHREADKNRSFAKHRRSSILKVPSNSENLTERIALQEIKNNPTKKKALPRRVSFSAAASVKEFRTGKEELTVWTSTYEENHDVSETISINESAACRTAQPDKTNIFSAQENSMDVTCGPNEVFPDVDEDVDNLKHVGFSAQESSMNVTCGPDKVFTEDMENLQHISEKVNINQSSMDFTCDVKRVIAANDVHSQEKLNFVNKTITNDFACDVQKNYNFNSENYDTDSLKKLNNFVNHNTSMDFTCGLNNILKSTTEEKMNIPKPPDTIVDKTFNMDFTCGLNNILKSTTEEKMNIPKPPDTIVDKTFNMDFTCDVQKVIEANPNENMPSSQMIKNLAEDESKMDVTLHQDNNIEESKDNTASNLQQLFIQVEKQGNKNCEDTAPRGSPEKVTADIQQLSKLADNESKIDVTLHQDNLIEESKDNTASNLRQLYIQVEKQGNKNCENIAPSGSPEIVRVAIQQLRNLAEDESKMDVTLHQDNHIEESTDNTASNLQQLFIQVEKQGNKNCENTAPRGSPEKVTTDIQQLRYLVDDHASMEMTRFENEVSKESSGEVISVPRQPSPTVEMTEDLSKGETRLVYPTSEEASCPQHLRCLESNPKDISSPHRLITSDSLPIDQDSGNFVIKNNSPNSSPHRHNTNDPLQIDQDTGNFAMNNDNSNPTGDIEKVMTIDDGVVMRDLPLENVIELDANLKDNHHLDDSFVKTRPSSRLHRQKCVEQPNEEKTENTTQGGIRSSFLEKIDVSTKVETDTHQNRLKRPAESHKTSHGGKERKNMTEVSAFDYFLMRQNQIPLYEDPLPHGRFELAEQNLRIGKVTFTFLHGSLALEIRLGFPLPAEEIEDGTSERKRTSVKHWTIRRIDFLNLMTGNESKESKLAHFLLLRQLKSTWFHEKCPTTCTLRETLAKVSSYVNDSAKFIFDMYMIQTSHFHFDVDDGHKVTIGFLNVDLDLSFHIQIDFSKGFGAAKLSDQIQVQVLPSLFKLKSDSIHQLAKAVQPGWKFLKSFVNYIDTYCDQLSKKK